jgi:hypothetical protein
VLELYYNLWGVGTGPPGYIGWRNRFLGIDSWASQKFKNTVSGLEFSMAMAVFSSVIWVAISFLLILLRSEPNVFDQSIVSLKRQTHEKLYFFKVPSLKFQEVIFLNSPSLSK